MKEEDLPRPGELWEWNDGEGSHTLDFIISRDKHGICVSSYRVNERGDSGIVSFSTESTIDGIKSGYYRRRS
jgi:hypothetical protein